MAQNGEGLLKKAGAVELPGRLGCSGVEVQWGWDAGWGAVLGCSRLAWQAGLQGVATGCAPAS